jgi:hypothetical protein
MTTPQLARDARPDPTRTAMSARGSRLLAYGIAATSLALTAAGFLFLLAITWRSGPFAIDANGTGGLMLGFTFSVVGAIVASRRPQNPIGWIYLAIGLSQGLNVFAWGYAGYGLITAPGSLPMADLMAWVGAWTWAPGLTLFMTISLLLFPDGHHLTPRWRLVSAAAIVSLFLMMVPVAVVDWPIRGIALVIDVPGSGGWPAQVADALQSAGVAILAAAAVASLASLVLRWRKASGIERAQLKWLALAVMIEIPVVFAASNPDLDPRLGAIIAICAIPLIPAAIGIAILRYRLYDIDRIISRTLSYGVVTLTLAIVFIGIVLGLTAIFQSFAGDNTVAVAASTLVVAALFQPLRRRVKGRVDRRFDRARYDGQRTADAFAGLMRDETDLDAVEDDLTSVVDRVLAPRDITLWINDRRTGSVTDSAVSAIP